MNLWSTDGRAGPAAFRIPVLAALIAAVTQVTLGGVVRVTGSGLGCPDWPLCHGKLVPPFDAETLIEYSHRLSAALLGALVLLTVVLAWRNYRLRTPAALFSALALLLVLVAAVVGGVTVRMDLAWWVVVVHLAIAELVVGCLVVASAAGWGVLGMRRRNIADYPTGDGFRILVVAAVLGTLGLILLGSYMVGLGYGSACATWPLCRGDLLPDGVASTVHMLHRYVAAVVAVLVATITVSAWRLRDRRPDLAWASVAAAALFALQSIAGAATVWTGFAQALKATHLAVGTVTLASLVLVAYRLFAPSEFPATVTKALPSSAPSLEGVSP